MNNKAFKLAVYSLYAVCFLVFFSTALTAIFSVLMILFWLGSGAYKNIPEIIKENQIVILSFILFVLFVVGVFYTPAPLEDALDFLKKYRVLLYIPIVMSLCRVDNSIGRNILNSFFIGYFALLVNVFLVDFGFIPVNKSAAYRHGGGFLVIFAYHKDRLGSFFSSFIIILCSTFFLKNTIILMSRINIGMCSSFSIFDYFQQKNKQYNYKPQRIQCE